MSFNINELSKLDISKEQLEELKTKKIFFGHQSVGNNILDGLKKLMDKNPELKLNIKMVDSLDIFDQPVFGHSKVGKNGDPKSKCDSFKEIMDSGIGEKVDIAFFKLCFVDIGENTNLKETFDHYANTMEYLNNKYHEVTFIHVTTPLTAIPQDLKTKMKSLVKRIIRKPDWVYTSVIQKNSYNNLIRKKCYGNKPIYDLASIESTLPDGHRETFKYNKSTYYSLVPIYTYDEGHLNDLGQIQAAKALIKVLCELN